MISKPFERGRDKHENKSCKIIVMISNQYQEIHANNLKDNKFCLVSDGNKLSWSSRIGWIFYPRDMKIYVVCIIFFCNGCTLKYSRVNTRFTILMIAGFNLLQRNVRTQVDKSIAIIFFDTSQIVWENACSKI